MKATKPVWYSEGLPLLLATQELPASLLRAALEDLVSGTFDETAAAVLLTALRMKREAPNEIATAVSVLRTKMKRLTTNDRPVLDTCGTGGDGSGTFNISTAVALVVASCGVGVVKHGNRSVSSRSGSADVLAVLRVPVDSGCDWSQQTFNAHNFAFCFAPHFHPALAAVGPLRRKLGFRTIFNLLGPLLNPAGAEHQLLGVGHPDLLDPVANALAILGTRQAFVVCGRDGLDEVTLSGPTLVRRVTAEGVEALEWTPKDFQLQSVALTTIQADGPETSAQMILQVLEGEVGPARRIVLANAAAGLFAIGAVPNLVAGVEMAAQAVDTGQARALLERLADSAAST